MRFAQNAGSIKTVADKGTQRRQWADNMLDLKMTREERDHVTLLISGLTAAQDFLCEGALRGLGYNVRYFGI